MNERETKAPLGGLLHTAHAFVRGCIRVCGSRGLWVRMMCACIATRGGCVCDVCRLQNAKRSMYDKVLYHTHRQCSPHKHVISYLIFRGRRVPCQFPPIKGRIKKETYLEPSHEGLEPVCWAVRCVGCGGLIGSRTMLETSLCREE